MRSEDELRTALFALEQEAPAVVRVMPKTIIPNEQGLLPRPTRHRRLAGLTAALGAAAVIGAGVAVVVALLPGARPANHQQAQALPSHQALRAKLLGVLSAASGEIIYEQATYLGDKDPYVIPAPGTATESWYYPWRAKVGQLVRGRVLTTNLNGTPLQDSGVSFSEPTAKQEATSGEYTIVDYATHTWSELHNSGLLADSDPGSPLAIWDLVHDNKDWSVVGRTELNGRPAIEPKFNVGSGGTRYLWIDAKTYLPLRETFSGAQLITGSRVYRVTQHEDYQYLAPTAANLAKLTVPIPPAFRRTAQPATPKR